MAHHVSIFDIPHITAAIGSYLERQDLLSCTLVDKTFYNTFNPLLWNELVFEHPPDRVEMDLDPIQKDAFLSKASMARILCIETACRYKGILGLLSLSSCNRLRIMKSIVSSQSGEDMSSMVYLLNITANNKQLESWSLGSWVKLSADVLWLMTMTLSRVNTCLSDLELGFSFNPPHGWFPQLLKHLPLTLKSLYMFWTPPMARVEREVCRFTDQPWPESYPYLETMTLSFSLDEGVEELPFLQFLERCPALIKLGCPRVSNPEAFGDLVTVLGTPRVLPALKELDIGWQPVGDQWDRLVLAMKGRIHRFTTDSDTTMLSTDTMSLLATQWSDLLESLRLPRLLTENVELILTKCPNLKKFDCMWTANQVTDVDSNDMEGLADWTCTGLEELRLAFADGRGESVEEPVLSMQEKRAIRRIHRAYKQIGRLTKLKSLTLGWRASDTFKHCANLDLSMKSGLENLAGLKGLNKLEISQLRHLNIGMEEVQWIINHWRQLKKLRGFKYRLIKDPEPDYVVQLRSGLPDLELV